MRYVPAIAITAALALAATAASATSKKHYRYAAHPRASVVVAPAPYSTSGPPHMVEARPGVWISSYGCIQDEGYGRWTYCGQGARGQ
jgi:hypothetical protein